jgi:diadenosine tetraphosphate (Ap4A) HIT family hydrolase
MKNEIKREVKILFPNNNVFEGKYFEVHQDWEFPIQGFFILVPKRRIDTITDFTREESIEFVNTLIKIRKAMRRILKIKEVFFYQNEDTRHNFHVWIFPKHPWMKNFKMQATPAIPFLKYSLDHFSDKKDIKKVKTAAKKMHDYLSK